MSKVVELISVRTKASGSMTTRTSMTQVISCFFVLFFGIQQMRDIVVNVRQANSSNDVDKSTQLQGVSGSYGIIALSSYLRGKVYISGNYVGKIDGGDTKECFRMRADTYTVEVKGLNISEYSLVTVDKEETTFVTVKPPQVSVRHRPHILT